ncbi:MAG: FAD-dependent oxidoreductase [Defluviitaleaceae bacterium]|nr:FAD-dependent oxidoreductase [Defluviitaleaceae bacterium]
MSKIVLVGANHAGTAAANTILDNYSGNEVIIFDANSNISYLGCGTALYIGKQIKGTDGLFYSSKEALEKKAATVHMNTKVQEIDFDKKILKATGKEGNIIEQDYDKLILATGSYPVTPNIPGAQLDGVNYVKLYQDGQKIDADLDLEHVKSVAVVGAGYIGVEIAEAVKRRNKKSMLFDIMGGCLNGYYDSEFTADMDKILADGGIDLHYGESIKEIRSKDGKTVSSIVTNKGEYDVDMVIMAIGFKPRTNVAKETLKLGPGGAFLVDLHQQTSNPDVYAVGDCATIYNNAKKGTDYIALATNAVRSGIVAGHNVCGTNIESAGVQGSNGICIFNYKMFSTGLTLGKAKELGFDAAYSDFKDNQRPEFMEENDEVKIRVVYDKTTRRILGTQLASYCDVSMGIHVFSLAIAKEMTINELPLLDIFFMPHFNKPFNYITMAGLLAK